MYQIHFEQTPRKAHFSQGSKRGIYKVFACGFFQSLGSPRKHSNARSQPWAEAQR